MSDIKIIASSLQKHGHVILKGEPCKIVGISTSKTGKHGNAKCHIVGRDIFEGKYYEDVLLATDFVTVPSVVRKHYSLVDYSKDGYVSLIDDEGNTRKDLKAPDNILEQISEIMGTLGEKVHVIVLSACGKAKVVNVEGEGINCY